MQISANPATTALPPEASPKRAAVQNPTFISQFFRNVQLVGNSRIFQATALTLAGVGLAAFLLTNPVGLPVIATLVAVYAVASIVFGFSLLNELRNTPNPTPESDLLPFHEPDSDSETGRLRSGSELSVESHRLSAGAAVDLSLSPEGRSRIESWHGLSREDVLLAAASRSRSSSDASASSIDSFHSCLDLPASLGTSLTTEALAAHDRSHSGFLTSSEGFRSDSSISSGSFHSAVSLEDHLPLVESGRPEASERLDLRLSSEALERHDRMHAVSLSAAGRARSSSSVSSGSFHSAVSGEHRSLEASSSGEVHDPSLSAAAGHSVEDEGFALVGGGAASATNAHSEITTVQETRVEDLREQISLILDNDTVTSEQITRMFDLTLPNAQRATKIANRYEMVYQLDFEREQVLEKSFNVSSLLERILESEGKTMNWFTKKALLAALPNELKIQVHIPRQLNVSLIDSDGNQGLFFGHGAEKISYQLVTHIKGKDTIKRFFPALDRLYEGLNLSQILTRGNKFVYVLDSSDSALRLPTCLEADLFNECLSGFSRV